MYRFFLLQALAFDRKELESRRLSLRRFIFSSITITIQNAFRSIVRFKFFLKQSLP